MRVSVDWIDRCGYNDHNCRWLPMRCMVKSASVGLRDVKIHLSKYIKMAQQDTEGIAQKRLQEDR